MSKPKMVWVKTRTKHRFDGELRNVGDVYEVSAAEAIDLEVLGFAEITEPEPEKEPELEPKEKTPEEPAKEAAIETEKKKKAKQPEPEKEPDLNQAKQEGGSDAN